MSVNLVQINFAPLNLLNAAPRQGNEIGPHRGMSRKDTGKRIIRVFAGMNFYNRSFIRRVVFVKPVEHKDVRKLFKSLHRFPISFINLDPGLVINIANASDRCQFKRCWYFHSAHKHSFCESLEAIRKNGILVQYQGRTEFQPPPLAGQTAGPAKGGIEDLKRGPNAEIGRKDIFNMAYRRPQCSHTTFDNPLCFPQNLQDRSAEATCSFPWSRRHRYRRQPYRGYMIGWFCTI